VKEKNKIALLVVVSLGIILIAGQLFLSVRHIETTGSNISSSTAETQPSIPATAVVRFVPSPAEGMATQSGSCWTNSIAAPYRSDAWRCSVGNSISDPCFQIAGSKNLMCGINPEKPSSTETFVLTLTTPLPAPQLVPGGVPNNWAWLIELKDGTLCSPFTGTRPFTAEGDSANYGCAPGPQGNDVLIFGDLDASKATWFATLGTLKESGGDLPTLASSSAVPVAKVWQ